MAREEAIKHAEAVMDYTADVADLLEKQQNKIRDLEYNAQEREKHVVYLQKQWQAAEMFICTMCGHFDYDIDGNIVYGNKDCGEIVGYPCCKKFTPWIPCWECCGQDNYCVRPNNKPGGCRNGCIVPKLYTRLAQYEDTGLSPMGMHLLPSPPKEGGAENG